MENKKKATPCARRLGSIYEAPKRYSLSWRHVKYDVAMKRKRMSEKELNNATSIQKQQHDTGMKSILKDVSGRIAPGEMLAIMGPSGSGKTTMLDILADRVSSGIIRGSILINGKDRGNSMNKVAKYVAQHDALLGCFTVLETLQYTANLTFSANTTAKKKTRMIESVVDELGLKSCLHTRVGDIFIRGISGGQKRRLSIAVELLGRPSILLLDEPTSGLDSTSAFGVMEHLKDLVAIGHSIAVTIHQPPSSVWELFTHFMLLVEGRTVYFGRRDEAIPYFSRLGLTCPQYSNPSDYFLQVVNTDFADHADVDDLVNQFLSSEECHTLIQDIEYEKKLLGESTHGAIEDAEDHKKSVLNQFSVLMKRSILNNIRNPGIYLVRAIMYFLIGTVAGSMYWNEKDGGSNLSSTNTSVLLFFVHAFMVFLSLSVLPFFIDQRAVFLRERANGLISVLPYVVANCISSFPIIFVISLISSSIVVNLAQLDNAFMFGVILFSVLSAAESFSLCISAIVSHYIIGIAMGSGIFGAMLLCSGMTVTKSTMPFYWIWLYYIGINTYAFEAFMLNQFDNDSIVIKSYEMEDGNIFNDIGVLWIHVSVFQVSFFLLLYYMHTGRR